MIRLQRVPVDIHEKIEHLGDFFMRESNVLFVYLFGGLMKKTPSPLSDVDLAVYVKNPKKLDYLKLFGKISRILCTEEMDLILLNEAPLSLAGRILQNRKVLIDKNPFLRQEYESLILRKYFDFTIKERGILERRYGIG